MLTAKQFIRAAGKGIYTIDFTFTGVITGSRHHRITGISGFADAGGFIECPVDIHHLTVDMGFGMGAVQCGLPAVIERLLQGGEQLSRFFIAVRPVRCGVKAATIIGFAAVQIPARHTAPGRAVGVGLLEFVACVKQGGIGEVGINGGINEFFGGAVAFNVAVFVLITGDQAATYAAGFVQRCG
ncbi:hypothetical protein SRABI106_04166 [Rahnella aquatilis]|nr:hypothetical protein SRABI106_04166 [Rahnella aquatilis]